MGDAAEVIEQAPFRSVGQALRWAAEQEGKQILKTQDLGVGQGSVSTSPHELDRYERKVLAAYVLAALSAKLHQDEINILRAYHLQDGIEAVTDWYVRTYRTDRIIETAGRLFIRDTVAEWAGLGSLNQQKYAEASGVLPRTLHYWREGERMKGTDGIKQRLSKAKDRAQEQLKDEFRRRGLIRVDTS